MDWNLAIEKNWKALKRILIMLVAMIEAAGNRPNTLPRHLHRFVLRLLRPAEAAVRRLIIVAARELVVKLAPPRIRKPKPKLPSILLRSLSSPTPHRTAVPPGKAPRALAFPLLDTLHLPRRRRPKQRSVPRIYVFGSDQPFYQLPSPPSPDDELDAGRLNRRLDAIASALDDLPRQAKRLARWQACRDAGRVQRVSPMKPGRPQGCRREPNHDVYEVLNEVHGLAVWARERPDTS